MRQAGFALCGMVGFLVSFLREKGRASLLELVAGVVLLDVFLDEEAEFAHRLALVVPERHVHHFERDKEGSEQCEAQVGLDRGGSLLEGVVADELGGPGGEVDSVHKPKLGHAAVELFAVGDVVGVAEDHGRPVPAANSEGDLPVHEEVSRRQH